MDYSPVVTEKKKKKIKSNLNKHAFLFFTHPSTFFIFHTRLYFATINNNLNYIHHHLKSPTVILWMISSVE